MTKEKFIELLTELVRLKKLDDEFRAFTKKLDRDSYGVSFFNQYELLVLKCLEESTDDKGSWISLWLYDYDCGTDKNANSVKDAKTGKKIPFKTPGNVYDCITKYK